MSHLADLCLHNQITQVALHKRWTTLKTTTVYYGKPNGEHQNKSTSIQTSPRNAVSAGTTTTTQTNKPKGFTGWWNPNHASTIPHEVYSNRSDTTSPPPKVNHIGR